MSPVRWDPLTNRPKHLTRVVGFTVMLALTLAYTAQARTIHCGAEDVQCLIVAINEANDDGHHKTTIRLAPGTYTLTNADNDTDGPNGLPSITSNLTMEVTHNKMASLIRSSDRSFRLFHVGTSGHLTLQGLSISGGEGGF